MQTVVDILRKTTDWFTSKGIDQPRLQAELLLSAHMGCKRLDLYLQHDRPLTDQSLEGLRAWVRRRAMGEPLQYIVGETEFCNLKLKTDARALIPRPETEQLVEMLMAHYEKIPPQRILDLGTGTGAIALALADHFKEATVMGIDCCPKALSLAKENAAKTHLNERVCFQMGNWLEGLKDESFDLIVSNPPYLTHNEWQSAQVEVRAFEPLSALVAENEGLADLNRILEDSLSKLTQGGLLALETGITHHSALHKISMDLGYINPSSLKDYQNRDRFFWASKASADAPHSD
jgi:release factor glutamine methyltransferase